jgi:hypothetical protein
VFISIQLSTFRFNWDNYITVKTKECTFGSNRQAQGIEKIIIKACAVQEKLRPFECGPSTERLLSPKKSFKGTVRRDLRGVKSGINR